MNNRPKQVIVDRGELSRGLVDWALLHGIVIVSRAPDRRDTVDGRAVHQRSGFTDSSLPSQLSRGDQKGQIERAYGALKVEFRRSRRYDK
jgi:hypothetical protein